MAVRTLTVNNVAPQFEAGPDETLSGRRSQGVFLPRGRRVRRSGGGRVEWLR